MIQTLSAAYGAAAAWRRRRFERDPLRRHQLRQPVISVGNLRVGGSGKTPIVEYLARLLIGAGERPAILTRGYARRSPQAGATVVSDGSRIIATLDAAGDEPLMLARAVPRAIVVVGANRYVDGLMAERRLGATVHLLDDGFQHFELARDADLLLASDEDLVDRPLPAGRLRERLDAARRADAVLATATYQTAAERIARALHVETAFRVTRTIGAPRMVAGTRETVVVPPESRVFLVTGIARPERFEADIAAAGWHIAGALHFRDHHPFDARDVRRIVTAAQAARCAIVLTTEKDAVRLDACDLGDLPIASVPLVVGVEPVDAFRQWLLARIQSPAPSPQPPS